MKFIKKVRENLKDPKKKSLTLLGLYAIFFIFVFVLLQSAQTRNVSNIPKIEENNTGNTIDSYEYIYKITNNTKINEITGTHKDNKDLFIYNELKYYKEDNVIYLYEKENLKEVETLGVDIDKYNYDNVKKIIDASNLVDETIYKDESSKNTYNIDLLDYLNLLNEENSCKNDCSNIIIPITVNSNNYINSVTIDLSEYYKYKFLIEINYSNINNIDNIKISTTD